MEFRTEFADYKDELAFLRAYLTGTGVSLLCFRRPGDPGL